MEDLSLVDSAIEAAGSGAAPRALRVEELIYEGNKNISRSGSFSSLSGGDTSGTYFLSTTEFKFRRGL